MSKIAIEIETKKYTLEFTKDTVRTTEKRGFKLGELFEFPTLNVPLLVQGAFLKHHKYLTAETIEKIYQEIPDQQDFIVKLAEMYNDQVAELLGMTEGADKGKKAKWETVS